MRKFKGTKMGKRILSVALAVGMVLAMLPIADRGMVSQADETYKSLKNYTSGGKKVVRGVVDSIDELPQAHNDNWEKEKVGTAKRPFTILEIVPYEEYAEFGYLIGGCEPVTIEELHGNATYINLVASFSDANTVTQTGSGVYFFTDEPEGQKKYYSGMSDAQWANLKKYDVTVSGYYEVVDEAEGTFWVKEESNKKTIVKIKQYTQASDKPVEGAVYLKWHSLNPNVDGYGDLSNMSFSQNLQTASLEEIGDRLYTNRPSTEDDYVVDVGQYYWSYVNDETFLRDTIGLVTDEEVNSYSVVIKTITPDKLNETQGQKWIDYADLIYVSPKMHVGTADTVWAAYNRLGHTAAATHEAYAFYNNDLSWNTVKKIVEKNTKQTNYAAMLIDNTLYEYFTKAETPATCRKTGLSFQMYDYNLNAIKKNGIYPSQTGVNNNLYKMILMLVAQNPNLVKNIFWDHLSAANPASGDSKIEIDLQTGDARTYWNETVFLLLDASMYESYGNGGVYNFFEKNKDLFWDNYNYLSNFHTERAYVQNRTYTYNGDTSIAQQFRTGHTSSSQDDYNRSKFDNFFTDFDHYVKTDEDTIDIWKRNGGTGGMTGSIAPPSAALRYILGMGKDMETPTFGGTLKVLDVEPAIGLTAGYTPDWKFKESYVRMLVPNFTGDIEITHMTMNSFVGRTDDLNSVYDLIYFGPDTEAFWKDSEGKTDFNDVPAGNGNYTPEMDGWIYFHIGDLVYASGKLLNGFWRTSNFIAGISDNSIRFPGNDITINKINDLEEFMKAGFPIVADSALYVADKMDPSSNMRSFLTSNDAGEDSTGATDGVYDVWQTSAIENRVRSVVFEVVFEELPMKYVENTTQADGAVTFLLPDGWRHPELGRVQTLEELEAGKQEENTQKIKKLNKGEATYLPGKMKFSFKVPNSSDYSYSIYVDQSRNGKFEDSEVVLSGKASEQNNIEYPVARTMVGLIQWRIEVYKTDKKEIRDSREGCSAIQCEDESKKEKINVLQIEPSKTGSNYADLSNPNGPYASLYKDLDAFEIHVDLIDWSEFEHYFEGTNFSFNMSESIKLDEELAENQKNPKNKKSAESLFKSDGSLKQVGNGQDLSKYNMIVIGFDDSYGRVDLSDKNGAAEYLYYFAMDGGSILFTHDNTSLYNVSDNPDTTPGYTANALLRDLMGMNRYGVNNNNLNKIRTGTDFSSMLDGYRQNRKDSGLLYDTTNKPQKQAFTINAIRRITESFDNYKYNGKDVYRLPYRYMVEVPGSSGSYIGSSTGLDGNLCTTTMAKRMNVGQITEYPYNISEDLPIAETHAQWYQLNMEDPELTVWYTLEYPGNGNQSAARALAASPQDAANNYYIYSKGNIFYSGVGHSDTTGSGSSEMERKLFINTLIAAYRARYAAPTVEVTNPEASLIGADAYALRIPREFNYNGSSYTVEDLGDDKVKVTFRPLDSSFSNKIKCRIYYSDVSVSNLNGENSIMVIRDAETGAAMGAVESDGYYIPDLKNAHEYYFLYEKSKLADHPQLTFEVKNDRKDESGFATLKILAQPLFKLD